MLDLGIMKYVMKPLHLPGFATLSLPEELILKGKRMEKNKTILE